MDATRIGRNIAASLALLLLAVGCAPLKGGNAGNSTDPADADVVHPTVQPLADEFRCANYTISKETLETPLDLERIDSGLKAAMEASERDEIRRIVETPGRWVVLVEQPDLLLLFAPIEEDPGYEPGYVERELSLYDHGTFALATNPVPSWEVHEGSGWYIQGGTGCALRPDIDLGELDFANISLDPENLPTPESTEIPLLVIDHSCGGYKEMPQRIKELRVDEDDFAVGLLIGLEPLTDGMSTCQGFPPEPYTVKLDRPLGQRAIVDLSRAPTHKLIPPSN